jgi:hypothetical protein
MINITSKPVCQKLIKIVLKVVGHSDAYNSYIKILGYRARHGFCNKTNTRHRKSRVAWISNKKGRTCNMDIMSHMKYKTLAFKCVILKLTCKIFVSFKHNNNFIVLWVTLYKAQIRISLKYIFSNVIPSVIKQGGYFRWIWKYWEKAVMVRFKVAHCPWGILINTTEGISVLPKTWTEHLQKDLEAKPL